MKLDKELMKMFRASKLGFTTREYRNQQDSVGIFWICGTLCVIILAVAIICKQ